MSNKIRKFLGMPPKAQKTWNDDKSVITITNFHPDFSVKSSAEHIKKDKEFVKHGNEKTYSDKAELITESQYGHGKISNKNTYENGQLVESCQYNYTGKPLTKSTYNAGETVESRYDHNGEISSQTTHLKDKTIHSEFNDKYRHETCTAKDGTVKYENKCFVENKPYTGTVCVSSSRKRALYAGYVNGFSIGPNIGVGRYVQEQAPEMQTEFERQDNLITAAKAAIASGNTAELEQITQKALREREAAFQLEKESHVSNVRKNISEQNSITPTEVKDEAKQSQTTQSFTPQPSKEKSM